MKKLLENASSAPKIYYRWFILVCSRRSFNESTNKRNSVYSPNANLKRRKTPPDNKHIKILSRYRNNNKIRRHSKKTEEQETNLKEVSAESKFEI